MRRVICYLKFGTERGPRKLRFGRHKKRDIYIRDDDDDDEDNDDESNTHTRTHTRAPCHVRVSNVIALFVTHTGARVIFIQSAHSCIATRSRTQVRR